MVIHRLQCARCKLGGIAAVIGRDGQRVARVQLLLQCRDLVLRQREYHGDGLQLSDHHEAVRLGRRYVVAERHLLQTDAPRDRRDDVAVDEIQLGGVDLSLIGFDIALVLHDE